MSHGCLGFAVLGCVWCGAWIAPVCGRSRGFGRLRLFRSSRVEDFRRELSRREDADALEGLKAEQIVVAGDDVVGSAVDGGLQNPIVALVVHDRQHAGCLDHLAARRNEIHESLCFVDHLCELRIRKDAAQLGEEWFAGQERELTVKRRVNNLGGSTRPTETGDDDVWSRGRPSASRGCSGRRDRIVDDRRVEPGCGDALADLDKPGL